MFAETFPHRGQDVVAAGQDGDVPRCRALGMPGRDVGRQPVEFLREGVEAQDTDLTIGCTLPGAQFHPPAPVARERLGQGVAHIQDPAAAAAVDGERELLCGFPRCPGEVGGKPEDVRGSCSAPPVDRLVRIPDGGHWKPAARRGIGAAEQCAQQDCLRRRGVLVLIEQDHPEPLSERGADHGEGPRQFHGLGLLIGEFH